VSHQYSSLAFDEALKEFDSQQHYDASFEPELTVLVNERYGKTSLSSATTPLSNVLEVKGRITVSF
jgi:hypothetical protein